MKYKISFLVIMFFPSLLFSQIISQPGHVRKISYNKSNQTVPVSDVRLKVETESRSDDKLSLIHI